MQSAIDGGTRSPVRVTMFAAKRLSNIERRSARSTLLLFDVAADELRHLLGRRGG